MFHFSDNPLLTAYIDEEKTDENGDTKIIGFVLLYFLILSRNLTSGLRVLVNEPPSRIRFPPKLFLKL